jgi:hypothetical protein
MDRFGPDSYVGRRSAPDEPVGNDPRRRMGAMRPDATAYPRDVEDQYRQSRMDDLPETPGQSTDLRALLALLFGDGR